jgi:hypothetical protein
MKLIALLAAVGALAGGAVKATLTAPTHTPKVNTKWFYIVRVTEGGKAASARLTAQIVDPLGSAHPVTFDATKKPIKNFAFKGTFRDYVIWPADSRGIPLTLRLTIRVGTTKKVLTYRVTSRS